MASAKAGTRLAAGAPEEEARERGGIQSIERAFAILEEVARSRDGIALSELGRRLGLHNSTAFHLIQTMVSLGYVKQQRETRRYHIGRPLFALAAAARDDVELVGVVTPVLEGLSAATGETGHFGVWSGDSVVVLAKTPGAGAFQMVSNVGLLRPAYCTGLGKALLASLDPAQLERYLAIVERRPLSPKTVVDADQLRQQLDEIRRTGIAFDDGEFDPEVRCVAVPVRDFTGKVTGVIGVSGPIWRLSLHNVQEKAAQVREAAQRLSAELGFPGATQPGAG
ncbi:MAG: IclR family transcriptional regulator [Rhodospirillales bacterium]|nr:IclR family transcriptional regulator [Rhodospirillales bacterium]MDE2198004.1 IclR family transcriptional regulator [Rhodospirillales bacterium]MDE2574566.1 IclR family transcriptional regulator [Rhodospirillales bacterium]